MSVDTATVTVVIPWSPDHTPEKLLKKAKASVHSQSVETDIIVVRDDDQRGPAWARNKGMKQAQTRFVALLDADDRWTDEKLMRQLERMKETNAGICIQGNSREYDDFVKGMFDGSLHSVTSSILLDTEQVKTRFDEALLRYEDHLFVIEAATEAGICFVPNLVEIHKHDGGLSAETDQQLHYEMGTAYANAIRKRVPEAEEHLPIFFKHFHYNQGRLSHFENKYRDAVNSFWKSLKYGFQIKTVLALLWSLSYLAGRRLRTLVTHT
ncbi:glycosyltransferase [Halosimplex halobium]|uniref:glycosyltransferase n=1 Tax=Halosimplex halobium TaxID=3396618 RepID=UPI003F561DF8